MKPYIPLVEQIKKVYLHCTTSTLLNFFLKATHCAAKSAVGAAV